MSTIIVTFDTQAGSRLLQERERLALSQQGLADSSGIARTMLSRYERAAAEPSAGSLISLSRAGVDVLYVLTGARTPPGGSLSDDERALLASYARADETGRAALQSVAALARRPAAGASRGGNSVEIGGDVGQAIAGDASFSAPVSFSLGGKKKTD
ncbi:hypothetical protein C8245_13890 [Paracidovorax avenae]|uniref:helix-turn-helix domain-containing protein n=1 Tax=Paracidovorax avenae TaxID=80867 RepID=UPI000D224C6A|nr:helix-turn-helix transcriptional regulator [Paracidovorax avenae]AVS66626.1 hypothetical protein C8245_13890 [Paracidovorax avenae]